jgi:hypothetical protein
MHTTVNLRIARALLLIGSAIVSISVYCALALAL